MKTSNNPSRIVLAEDNAADVFLVKNALLAYNLSIDLHVIDDGENAVRFIEAVERYERPMPELLLLDFNLPRVTGGEILTRVRSSLVCGHIPVLMISSSDMPWGGAKGAQASADGFFRKPSDYDEYMLLGGIVKDFLRKTTPEPLR